jgi:HSP20 family molecular chaperone IbpA
MDIDRSSSSGLSGLFENLRRLTDRLDDLAEGGEIERTVRFGDASSDIEGIAGIRIRTASDTGAANVQVGSSPHSADAPDAPDESEADPRVRRPVADVQEAGGAFLIHADMPGISASDVQVDRGEEGRWTITAVGQGRRYRVDVDLPRPVAGNRAEVRADRGIVQIRLPLDPGAPDADADSAASEDTGSEDTGSENTGSSGTGPA